jgi:mono/diheme cytochrome c family protein
MSKYLFAALSFVLLLLVGGAAFRDTQARDYLAIQEQYQKDHPAPAGAEPFDVKIQQVFPQYAAAKRGETYRVERCISCHVPDLNSIGSDEAAKRIWADFVKYEPNSQKMIKDYRLSGSHPTIISPDYYKTYGPAGSVSAPSTGARTSGAAAQGISGFLTDMVDPAKANGQGYKLDQVGCIVCHNGSRLALDEKGAHENLIVNPEYSWSEGAALYYQYCAQCHGTTGQGGIGPPLTNQDRLGFFNEDYYYRCIEWGLTGFEHYGSVMPNWGSIAQDYNKAEHPPGKGGAVATSRTLSEQQIALLTQFIRHWESYDTLP